VLEGRASRADAAILIATVPSATRFSSRMDIAHRPLEATAGKGLPPRDKWATPLGIGIH
jgi:hypothetical protein